jgi:hypothetical protein
VKWLREAAEQGDEKVEERANELLEKYAKEKEK